jgi:tetratricopeptide (TPR) repeat protein
LALYFLGGSLGYPVVLIQAIVRHTLLTTDRTLIDLRTLAWYIPLTVAGGWAFLDLIREDNALRARRLAKRVEEVAEEIREDVVRHWQRRLATAHKKSDRQSELMALRNIAVFLQDGDHYEEAMPYFEETLSLARALGNQPFYEESALYGLGLGAFKRGDPDMAEDLFRQCLAVAAMLGSDRRDAVADAYAHVGEFLCEYRGKREEGCQMLARAQALYHEVGQSRSGWLKDEQQMRDLRRKYGDESG